MVRSLARLRDVAGLHTRRSKKIKAEDGDGGDLEQLEREGRDSKKGVVRISVPGPWGVFVIKDEEGRVIVVDADGEYEGGGGADAEQVREGWGSLAARKRDGGESWSNEGFDEELGMRLSRHDEWKEPPEEGTKKSRSSRRSHRAKTPSLLTESESSTDKDFKPSPPASPTRFLMTGAQSGWPSPTPSPSSASPIVPHPYTWEDTIAPPTPSRPSSKLKTALQLFSRNNSLPGSWPSRTPSSKDTATVSTTSSSGVTYPEPRSPVSFHKTTTSHPTPDIVEVIYDETPPGELSHTHSQRPRSRSRSNSIKPPTSQHTQRSRRSQRSPSRHTTTTSPTVLLKNGSGWDDAPQEAGLRNLSHNSDAGWSSSSSFSVDFTGKGSENGAGSEAHSAATKPSVSIQNWADGGSVMHGKAHREWDGFERLKTISEVSVAGGSIRTQHGWPGSVRSRSPSPSQSGKSLHKSSPATHSSSHHGHARSSSDATYPSTSHSKYSKHSTHRSSRSHHKRSTTHSPTGWSSFSLPQRSAVRSADGWSTTVTHNVKKVE